MSEGEGENGIRDKNGKHEILLMIKSSQCIRSYSKFPRALLLISLVWGWGVLLFFPRSRSVYLLFLLTILHILWESLIWFQFFSPVPNRPTSNPPTKSSSTISYCAFLPPAKLHTVSIIFNFTLDTALFLSILTSTIIISLVSKRSILVIFPFLQHLGSYQDLLFLHWVSLLFYFHCHPLNLESSPSAFQFFFF